MASATMCVLVNVFVIVTVHFYGWQEGHFDLNYGPLGCVYSKYFRRDVLVSWDKTLNI